MPRRWARWAKVLRASTYLKPEARSRRRALPAARQEVYKGDELGRCSGCHQPPMIRLSLFLQNVVANAGYHGDVVAVFAHGTHHIVDMAVASALTE